MSASCPKCNGCGYMDSARSVPCPSCGGTGNRAEAPMSAPRAEMRWDGWYVVGDGMLIPAQDEREATNVAATLNSRRWRQ